jgi:hypothetical protein
MYTLPNNMQENNYKLLYIFIASTSYIIMF